MPKLRRNLNLYETSNESRFRTKTTTKPGLSVTKTKKKGSRYWILKQIEAADVRYNKRMNEFKLCTYLDETIKSIPNCIWVQERDRYLITLRVEVEIDDKTLLERDMIIDRRTKRMTEIARRIKNHHTTNMIIVDDNELIIYKNETKRKLLNG